MSVERRSSPRAVQPGAIALKDAQTEWAAQMRNLSASGVYCSMAQFIPPLSKLRVRFELPLGSHKVQVECTGVVVRVEPMAHRGVRAIYQTAIFFTEVSAQQRSAIIQFVRQRLATKIAPG